MPTNNTANISGTGLITYDGSGTFSALSTPLSVTNHGVGAGSFTAYSVLCGGTTSTANFQNVSGVGTSGQVLTSNGAGALPSWQTPSGGGALSIFVQTMRSASTLSDSTTYYLGTGNTPITSAYNSCAYFYIPISGTINTVYGTASVSSTHASAQNCTLSIRLNGSSDTTITSTLQLTAADNTFNGTGLGLSVSAGDYIQFKLVTPSWPTNPSQVAFALTALIS